MRDMSTKLNWRSACERANKAFVVAYAEGVNDEGETLWSWEGYDIYPEFPLVNQVQRAYGGKIKVTADFAFPWHYPERVWVS